MEYQYITDYTGPVDEGDNKIMYTTFFFDPRDSGKLFPERTYNGEQIATSGLIVDHAVNSACLLGDHILEKKNTDIYISACTCLFLSPLPEGKILRSKAEKKGIVNHSTKMEIHISSWYEGSEEEKKRKVSVAKTTVHLSFKF
jgi:hypothetical protein